MSPEVLDQAGEKAPKIMNHAGQIAGDLATDFIGRKEVKDLKQQEALVAELFSDPEAERTDLSLASTQLVGNAINSYTNGNISARRLAKIGDSVLSTLGDYRDGLGEEIELNVNGVRGFETTVNSLMELFNNVREDTEPAEDVSRTTRLLQFRSPKRYSIHEDFVDRYSWQLVEKSRDGDTVSSETSLIQTMWDQPEFLYLMSRRFTNLSNHHKDFDEASWPFVERELFEKTFEAFGFHFSEKSELLCFWNSFQSRGENLRQIIQPEEANIKRKFRLGSMATSFAVMSKLMTYGPDTVHDIYETFNIRNFGRYPAQALLEQYKVFRGDQDPPDKPVVLAVAGVNDWTGSMRKFYKRVEDTEPVYTEARSLDEIARVLERTKEKLGPINGLVIAGHGGKNEINLVGGGPSHSITTSRFMESEAFRLIKSKDYFTDGAEIIFLSCSTGKRKGFAATISETSGLDVIASPKWTHGKIIRDEKTQSHKVIFPNLGPVPRRFRINPTGNYARRFENGKRRRIKTVDLFD